jgi:beta-glucosidase
MFQPPIGIGPEGELLEGPSPFGGEGATRLVVDRRLNHFNIYSAPDARRLAEWQNSLQRLAETTRLGIPVTISSDPRHSFDENAVVSWSSGSFSQWPEPIGLAATRDEELVRGFGEIARQEYRAVGIHLALHPMADVATEPRWARIGGTFGEDFELVGRLAAAYVRGFQGDELGPASVACMLKHFPGGGPQADGEDPHFPYGKDQVYPGGRFDDHLGPFETVIAAGTAQVMPYYGRPVGTELEPVGFGFNRQVITGLLRGRVGFDGVVCTDWGLVTDLPMPDGSLWEAKAWGVEELDTAGSSRPAATSSAARSCRSCSFSLSRRDACRKLGSTSRLGGFCATSSGSVCSTTRTSIPKRPRRSVAGPTFVPPATTLNGGRWC